MSRASFVVARFVFCTLICRGVRYCTYTNAAIPHTPAMNASGLKPVLERAFKFLTFILEAPGKPVGRQRGEFPDQGRPNYRVLAQGAATAYLLNPNLFHATRTMWDGKVHDGSFWAINEGYAAIGLVNEKDGKVPVQARMLTYETPQPFEASFVLFQNRDGTLDVKDLLGRKEGLRSAIEDLDEEMKMEGDTLLPSDRYHTKANVVAAWRFCNYVNRDPDLAYNPPYNWAGAINYLPYAQTFGTIVSAYLDYLRERFGQICIWNDGVLIVCYPDKTRKGASTKKTPETSFYNFLKYMLESLNPGADAKRPSRITPDDWNEFIKGDGRDWTPTKLHQMLKVDEYEVVTCKTPVFKYEETVFDLFDMPEWTPLSWDSCTDTPTGTENGNTTTLDSCRTQCKERAPACTVIGYKETERGGECMFYAKCEPPVPCCWGSGPTGYTLEQLAKSPTEDMVARWMNQKLLAQEEPWPPFSIDFMSWAPTAAAKLSHPADVVVDENRETLRSLFKSVSLPSGGRVEEVIHLLASPRATREEEALRITQLRRYATSYMEAFIQLLDSPLAKEAAGATRIDELRDAAKFYVKT